MIPLRRNVLMLAVIGSVLACSADAVTPPEPQIDTAGAFIAIEQPDKTLTLYRVLSAFILQSGESLLFVSMYAVAPTSFEEARQLAARHDLPVHTELMSLFTKDVRQTNYRVVWFRTLNDKELDIFR